MKILMSTLLALAVSSPAAFAKDVRSSKQHAIVGGKPNTCNARQYQGPRHQRTAQLPKEYRAKNVLKNGEAVR